MKNLPLKPGLEPLLNFEKYTYPDKKVVVRVFDEEEPSVLEAVNIRQSAFLELKDFGLDVVDLSYAISDGGIISTTNFLDGYAVENHSAASLPEGVKEKSEDALNSLYKYLTHKIETGERFILDIYGLNQFMYIPKQDRLVMVDTGGGIVDERGSRHRFGFEMLSAIFLIEAGDEFFAHDKTKYTEWQQKADDLLELISRNNDLVLTERVKRKILRTCAVTPWKEEEKTYVYNEEYYKDILLSPENQHFLEAESRKRIGRML